MLKPAILSVFATVLACAVGPAQVTHYWIDGANGSDANPGSKAAPFKTLTFGLTTTNQDAVYHILPATYGPQTTGDFWDPVTSAGAALVLTDYKNVAITGSDVATCIVDFNGADGQWGFLQIDGQATDGLEIANLTFRNAGISPWGNGAIAINPSPVRRVDIHNNRFEDCNSSVILWGGFDCAVHDNIFIGTNQSGVAIRIRTQYYTGSNGDRTYVYHNTFYDCGHGISFDQNPTQQWICNNAVVNCNIGFPDSSVPASAVMMNNYAAQCVSNFNFTPPPTNLNTPLNFVNAAGGDFRLQPGSPGIEGGWTGTLPYRVNDYYGSGRVSDANGDRNAVADVGAYEAARIAMTVTNWAPGQGATFSVTSTRTTVFGAVVLIGVQPTSVVIQPYGLITVDLSSLVMSLALGVPGSATLPVPSNPSLIGLTAYAQPIALRLGSPAAFESGGRHDLLLQ